MAQPARQSIEGGGGGHLAATHGRIRGTFAAIALGAVLWIAILFVWTILIFRKRAKSKGGTKPEGLFPTAPMGGDVAATEQETEHRLLLELAKETFTRQVAKRVRPLSRGFVERWMKGDLWLYSDVVSHHATELRAYRPVVLEVLRATSVDEMLDICRKTRPDLTYLWHEPAAKAKLTKEIAEAIKAVESL